MRTSAVTLKESVIIWMDADALREEVEAHMAKAKRTGFMAFQCMKEGMLDALEEKGLLAPAPKSKSERDTRTDDERRIAQYRWEKNNPGKTTHSQNWRRKVKAEKQADRRRKFELKKKARPATITDKNGIRIL